MSESQIPAPRAKGHLQPSYWRLRLKTADGAVACQEWYGSEPPPTFVLPMSFRRRVTFPRVGETSAPPTREYRLHFSDPDVRRAEYEEVVE